jgi:hypothetical protein
VYWTCTFPLRGKSKQKKRFRKSERNLEHLY